MGRMQDDARWLAGCRLAEERMSVDGIEAMERLIVRLCSRQSGYIFSMTALWRPKRARFHVSLYIYFFFFHPFSFSHAVVLLLVHNHRAIAVIFAQCLRLNINKSKLMLYFYYAMFGGKIETFLLGLTATISLFVLRIQSLGSTYTHADHLSRGARPFMAPF